MATYKLIGQRWLRKYTASRPNPVATAAADAQKVVELLCTVPWEKAAAKDSVTTYHTEEIVDEESKTNGLDMNVKIRDEFDAALFCAGHSGGLHRAYANAAVYAYAVPSAAQGKSLASLAIRVTSDNYNSQGCRLHVWTSDDATIPTSCHDVRGEDSTGAVVEDGTTAASVAKRTEKEIVTKYMDGVAVESKTYWYPTTETVTLSPTGGLVLKKFLFLAVVLESYSTVRGNWLEGCSFIENAVEATLSADVDGWTDGATYDLREEEGRSFSVVSGGVVEALPDGGNFVRSITLQRSGDEFEKEPEVLAPLSRPRVSGVRIITNLSGAARFDDAHPLADTTGTIRSIQPCYLTTTNVLLCSICGDTDRPSFPDLPGYRLFYMMKYGLQALVCTNTIESAISDATLKAQYVACRDNLLAYDKLAYVGAVLLNSSGASIKMWINGERSFCNNLVVELSLNSACNAVASATVVSAHFPALATNNGKTFHSFGNVTYSGIYQTAFCCGYCADGYLNPDIDSSDMITLPYVGEVTSVSPVYGVNSSIEYYVVSGNLTSFNGVACKNGVLVAKNQDSYTVTRLPFDDLVTPDDYTDFRITASTLNSTINTTRFYITGAFRTLSGVRMPIAAKWDGSKLTAVDLPAGVRAPSYFQAGTLGLGEDSALWTDDPGEVLTLTDAYYKTPLAVTDAQSAYGLRKCYAKVYGGGLVARSVDSRPGASFVVRGDSMTIPVAAGDATTMCWNVSVAPLVVPFSAPTEFNARRIRVSWGATVAATAGSKVRVWLKRGAFEEAAPENLEAGFFTGAAATGGFEFVGEIALTDKTAGEATFDISPITDDVATLMFVAFVSQDDFNPSDGMTLPRGVGTLYANEITGETSGLDGGFTPDVALLA